MTTYRNRLSKMLAGITIAASMTAASGAAAQEKTIRMTTTWPVSINLIETDLHFVEIVNRLGKGIIQIDFFPGGDLVPSSEVLDAVQSGAIEAAGDWPGYWAGKDTAFGVIGAFPMLLTADDYRNWIVNWGGADLIDKVYGQYDIKYLPYYALSSESGLRSTSPITSLEDMSGKRVRMSGRPQGEILRQLGAAQVQLPGSEIYQALERGVIDAAEFSTPSSDWGMGFQEVTQHVIAPGWHQPGSAGGVMIKLSVWEELNDQQKAVLETAAQATMNWSTGHYERGSAAAVRAFEEAGTTVHKLSDDELARLQDMSNRVLEEESCANPLFAEVALSMLEYLADYEPWRAVQGEFAGGRNLSALPDIEKIRSCS